LPNFGPGIHSATCGLRRLFTALRVVLLFVCGKTPWVMATANAAQLAPVAANYFGAAACTS
jgi:hypothetical protein